MENEIVIGNTVKVTIGNDSKDMKVLGFLNEEVGSNFLKGIKTEGVLSNPNDDNSNPYVVCEWIGDDYRLTRSAFRKENVTLIK